MDQLKENFMSTFKKFLMDYKKHDPENSDVKKLLSLFSKVDFMKTAKKINANLSPHTDNIENKNEECINDIKFFVSSINLNNVWNDVDKNKFWMYLKIMNMSSGMIVQTRELESRLKDTSLEFNPYDGLEGGGIDTESITKNLENLKAESNSSGGIGMNTILNIIGKDKMKELNGLTDKLKNMTDEDIEEASSSIKKLLGDNSAGVDVMLKEITSELRNNPMENGDLFSSLSGMAESIGKRMKPKIQSGELNPNDLLNSTKTAFEKMIPKGQSDMINKMLNSENLENLDMSKLQSMLGKFK